MMWMKTEQGSKCYHRPSTQMLERLYISEPGQQVQDGLRVFHLPEEWMHVLTKVIPCPTLIIGLSRQCGPFFLLGFGAQLKQAITSIVISLLQQPLGKVIQHPNLALTDQETILHGQVIIQTRPRRAEKGHHYNCCSLR